MIKRQFGWLLAASFAAFTGRSFRAEGAPCRNMLVESATC
jgi:hypothetical protein